MRERSLHHMAFRPPTSRDQACDPDEERSPVKSQGGIGDSALKSRAAAHIDFIMSAATFQSGALVIVPCHWLQLIGTVTVGVNVAALGDPVAKWQKSIGLTPAPS